MYGNILQDGRTIRVVYRIAKEQVGVTRIPLAALPPGNEATRSWES
jgi:hypothetical protein